MLMWSPGPNSTIRSSSSSPAAPRSTNTHSCAGWVPEALGRFAAAGDDPFDPHVLALLKDRREFLWEILGQIGEEFHGVVAVQTNFIGSNSCSPSHRYAQTNPPLATLQSTQAMFGRRSSGLAPVSQ